MSFHDAFRELSKVNLKGNTPNIENSPSTISYQLSSEPETNPRGYQDAKAYTNSTLFLDDVSNLGRMEQAYNEGSKFVHMLYTYRSSAKALPVAGKDHSPEEKKEIYSLTFRVLQPEIGKLVQLMKFKARLLQLIQANVQMLALAGENKVVPEALYNGIVHMIDVVVRLDNLKDMKACLQNDFACYKRAFHNVRSELDNPDRYSEEIQNLQLFLADPKCPKSIILSHLKDKIQLIQGSELVFVALFSWAVGRLSNQLYVLPEEKWELIRLLPHIMYLLDSSSDEHNAFNVFRSKTFSASNVTKLFKQHPVVPLYGDMHISLIYLLARCPHYNDSISKVWGVLPVEEPKTKKLYDLSEHWVSIRAGYDTFVSSFTLLIERARAVSNAKGETNTLFSGDPGDTLSKQLSDATLEGIRLLSTWKDLVISQAAFKYSRPASLSTIREANANESDPGIEYERVVRYNYSETERHILIDTISLIKSLAGIMQRAHDTLAPIIRLHIHHQVQDFVQDKLNPLLHKADKKNDRLMESLLELRDMVVDWQDSDAKDAYKEKKRKASVIHKGREVPLQSTQLTLLQFHLQSLFDERAEGMKGRGLLRKTRDLSKSEVDLLQTFHRETYYYPYLLDLSGTLRKATDLGDLWYREFYLEMTKCVQFPIAMSLPWILIKGIIENPSSDMLESILYALDIYNDAAHTALHCLEQQFIYDEIEAEVNLVFDQLVFLLADYFYTYYKSVAASRNIDKPYRRKLQSIQNRTRAHEVDKQRLEITSCQRHIQLLGRSVDLNFLIAQHLNGYVRRDVMMAISRFQSSGLYGVCETHSVLQVIRDTHQLLCESIELESFQTVFLQCDERASPTSFRGKLAIHASEELLIEVVPNYLFNNVTNRFVRPNQTSASKRQGSKRRAVPHNHLYGAGFAKAFEQLHKLQRSFIGSSHTDSLVALLGRDQIPWLVECILAKVEGNLKQLLLYTTELANGLDKTIKLPKYQFGSAICFRTFEAQLKAIVEYPQLSSGVLQVAREIGNAIAFIYLLDGSLQRDEYATFVQSAPYLGLDSKNVLLDMYWNDVKPTSRETPLSNVTKSFASWVDMRKQREAVNPDLYLSQVGAPVLDHNVTVKHFETQTESACNLYLSQLEPCPLFVNVMQRLGDIISDCGAVRDWDMAASAQALEHGSGSQLFNPEHSTDFHRIWSAILFAACIPSNDGEETMGKFGDGVVWTGCTLIMLLGQKDRFELLDFNYHTMRVDNFEVSRAVPNTSVAVDKGSVAVTQKFLSNVRSVRRVSNSVFTILEEPVAACGVSSTGGSTQNTLLIFHPPE